MAKLPTTAAVEAALKKVVTGEPMTPADIEIADEYTIQATSMTELLEALLKTLPVDYEDFLDDDEDDDNEDWDSEDFDEDDIEVEEENYIYRSQEPEDTITPPATGINAILEQRGTRYGEFNDHAKLAQNLKYQLAKVGFYTDPKFKSIHREAVDMILHKLARIVNGDPDYIESWRDIAGYSQLVVDTLFKTEGATDGRVINMRVVDGKLTDIA